MISLKESFNNNKDVLYKFFSLLFRPFSIFFTLAYAHIKRYLHFSFIFNFSTFFQILLNFFNKIYNNFFLI